MLIVQPHNLYSSVNITVIKSNRMRNVYNILLGKCEGKRPWKTRAWMVNCINMDLKETENKSIDWLYLA
jgi:hypothetical protein